MSLTPTRKTFVLWGTIAGFFVVLLWLLSAVLAPFVVAAVLAYALTPLVDRLHALLRSRVARVWLVVLVECVFLVLVLGVGLLLVPILSRELPLMRSHLPGLLEQAAAVVQPLATQWGLPLPLDRESIQNFARDYLSANFELGLSSVVSSLRLGGSAVLTLLGNAVLVPVVLFYLLEEWHPLVALCRELIPARWRDRSDGFVNEADAVLGQYLRGQLLVMAFLAVYYSVALTLFGLDLAVPIGVFTGLAIFVPYLGFGLGLVLAVLAGLLEFSASSGPGAALLMVSVVYGAGQILESFFLTPRLVGERIGLHPLAVIFALLAFGQLFGLVGMLVALPVSAVLLVAVRRLRAAYLSSALYTG